MNRANGYTSTARVPLLEKPEPAMKRRVPIFVMFVGALGCHTASVPLPSLAATTGADTNGMIARGEYIVRNAGTCGACHNPNHDINGVLSGGAEFKDWRLGTIRSANLTSDSETGLGAWSDADIVRAMRTGQRKDGRLLAPVMPYEWLNEMSDRDAFAVARYLKSLPAVRHEVRQSPGLFLRLARAVFLRPKPGTIQEAPVRGPTAQYGQYLAQHVALCAECHTPTGGIQSTPDRGRMFAGRAHPPRDFPANPANLTPDTATGIGRWTEADFVQTIRTGVNPMGDSLHSFMPWRAVRRMTDDDLRSIYRYLRSITPVRNEVPRRTANAG